jgi:hypothetical protein
LRPAAAAALARAAPGGAPLTDEDIAAINTLLGRGEASQPFLYDTGLPPLPHLVSFGRQQPGNASSGSSGSSAPPSRTRSSFLSAERLAELAAVGGSQPMGWLVRR